MKNRRVVVTGIGAITPIGNNLNQFWSSLIEGKSGAAPITLLMQPTSKQNLLVKLKILLPQTLLTEKNLESLIGFASLLSLLQTKHLKTLGLLKKKLMETVQE